MSQCTCLDASELASEVLKEKDMCVGNGAARLSEQNRAIMQSRLICAAVLALLLAAPARYISVCPANAVPLDGLTNQPQL